jgi:hypothetical protein
MEEPPVSRSEDATASPKSRLAAGGDADPPKGVGRIPTPDTDTVGLGDDAGLLGEVGSGTGTAS